MPWWVKFLWACSRQCRKTTDNLPMDRQCKKTINNLHMDRQCKKTALEHLQCSRQCKKKKKTQQQQFTYGQTVQKNNINLHMDRQCKKNNINLHMDSTSICKLTHQLTVYQTRCLPLSAALVPVVCPQPGNPCERRVWRCEREKQHKKYITK